MIARWRGISSTASSRPGRNVRRSSPSIGFEKLGAARDTSPESLIRMFGRRGNPQAKNLFSVIGYLQKQAGLQLHVTVGPV
jgi:hypothetical protein